MLAASARWLVTSREHHNYTYDLTALNRDHLAWFVAAVGTAEDGTWIGAADARGEPVK